MSTATKTRIAEKIAARKLAVRECWSPYDQAARRLAAREKRLELERLCLGSLRVAGAA